MTDKEWLDKVALAYKVYSSEVGPKLHIEQFISWMHRQYGIEENTKVNK